MENKGIGANFNSIDEAQLYLYEQLLSKGERNETRGLDTLELFPVYFSVSNPKARITTLKGRNWKFAPALGELIWHLSKSKDVDFISTYLSNWKNFSEDKQHITGSCYGFKMFQKDSTSELSQWDNVVKLLKEDKNSRRAIIPLIDPKDEVDAVKLDISCTISLQFLVRNNKLDLIVNMRSNDLVWGLPYDFFLFSYLQEFMAAELDIPLGTYHHFAASLHIYERHFDLARKVLEKNQTIVEFSMPSVPSGDFSVLVQEEEKLRVDKIGIEEISSAQIDEYWKELLKVLYFHHQGKKKIFEELQEFKTNSIYAELV